MLDFFTIFSKGGIVLWCFQGTSQIFTPSINSLIKSVILQERTGNNSFNHEALTLKYKLDNEFELVFVVAYQKILQLSYVDKFLTDIQLEFRNKYKDDLRQGKLCSSYSFDDDFQRILREREAESKKEAQTAKTMRTFEQSLKSKKTVASMIENKKGEKTSKGKENKPIKTNSQAKEPEENKSTVSELTSNEELDEETLRKNREKFFAKSVKKPKVESKPSPEATTNKKRVKMAAKSSNIKITTRDMAALDFSRKNGTDMDSTQNQEIADENLISSEELACVGQMHGGLHDIEPESDSEDDVQDEESINTKTADKRSGNSKKASGGGMFSMFRNLVGSKTLTKEDMQSVLEKMKDHIIGKNVAADIAQKLCDSVATKLEGKVLGTFSSVTNTVKNTLNESCVQILSPRRRIDILRDAMEAKQHGRPYNIVFCGVNGVGKSTNLAKICFWLVENGFRVLIAACDTFRAGAVEQLRTHTRKLNALHPAEKHNGQQMVQLYEKGYGKDAAGIAMEAIRYAQDTHINIVLIDTAGRMQDNEPLMKALAKLINVNNPDLVLFVGEALVGNEAVDQLTKFNQALADNSNMTNPRLIDGIILTKFDTIDDKVGAAISMTYTTGQPIVFVGTGQTYTDLRNLNAKAVVHALLKA
ncbi:hypothetical protein ACJMK2_024438 [Sinanodonta woodiana]|uniref:SRP54-type proteins GTP-binding domain-containing protein n=1 Tax=Sinanodonta woodiana TaxID=1069815 RepID=A0ABD3XH65_SINWO